MKSPPATHLAPESFSTFYQRSTYQSLRGMNRAYEPPRGAPDALEMAAGDRHRQQCPGTARIRDGAVDDAFRRVVA